MHSEGWQPFVILNDYADAQLDAQQIQERIGANAVSALTGSCICCDGIDKLRDSVNSIPPREKGITLIEANGTSELYERLKCFLGFSVDEKRTMAEIAQEFGMSTTSVRREVLKVQEEFHDALRSQIADTLENPNEEEIRSELKWFFSLFEKKI